jgi:hypothetical protein
MRDCLGNSPTGRSRPYTSSGERLGRRTKCRSHVFRMLELAGGFSVISCEFVVPVFFARFGTTNTHEITRTKQETKPTYSKLNVSSFACMFEVLLGLVCDLFLFRVISCEFVVPDRAKRLEPRTHTKSLISPGVSNIQATKFRCVSLPLSVRVFFV